MATCPAGHQSASDDFCEVCGVLIGAAPSLGPGLDQDAGGTGPASMAGGSAARSTVAGSTLAGAAPRRPENCPRCVTPRDGQFCESCGHNFAASASDAGRPAQGPPPAAWSAVVSADRAYYDWVRALGGADAAALEFPAYCPPRRFPLARAAGRIGRRSESRGVPPEIDLAVPPADPGISRLHAVLLRAADGSWSVIDPGSANGTLLNGTEITPGQRVPLRDGDRIYLGAWTKVRLTRVA